MPTGIISDVFLGGFRQIPALSVRTGPEIIGKFQAGILLPCSRYCGVALQDPVTFQHVSCKLLRDPVAGTIELGSDLKDSIGYRE